MTKERSVFSNDLHKSVNLSSFKKIIFKVGTCLSLSLIFRSSNRRCSVKNGVLKNFTGKHLRWSLDLLKIQKRLQHKCFPVKFAKLLRISILYNICKQLLLVLAGIQLGHATRQKT